MSAMRIGYIALAVTDLDRWTWFAQHIVGLREVERRGDTAYFTSNARHHQLRLTEGPAYGCTSIGVDVPVLADFDTVVAAARTSGLAVDTRDGQPGAERVAVLHAPGGLTIDVCNGVEAIPDLAYDVYGVRPKKLGHLTLAAEDPPALERMLVDVLGFRVSDRIPGLLAWLRCNADHHGIGLMAGTPGVQHYAFELEGWGDFHTLGDHIVRHGVRYVWGPGRHGPGNNLFAYFEDPDGGMIECFADVVRIDDETTYVPRDWPQEPTSLNQWGPGPVPEWFDYRTPLIPARASVGA